VRTAIDWRKVEPQNVTPDRFDWSHPDRAVGAVRDACLHLIATHGDDPAWAATGTDAPLEAFGIAELAEYLGALVERYDGDGIQDAPGSPIVRYWEIYNEPDGIFPVYPERWGDAGAEYAQMLAVVYPAIKAANPQAQVLLGGIAHDWFQGEISPFSFDFLDDVLAAGGGAYFDIMNFHTYPPFATNWATRGPGLYEKTQYMRAKLARYGLGKPIFITETAQHSNSGIRGLEGSDEIQMRHIAQLYTQALAAGVEALVWFSLADPGGQYPFDSGLITHNVPVQPKPAFAVYQTIAAQLGSARFVREVTVAETGNAAMEAYQFVDEERAVVIIVAWLDPVETNKTAILSLPANQAAVRDIVGAVTLVHDGDDGSPDGRVHVQVTGRPVYIEIGR
jgi:hypothetical protein